jgi:hypothetical protein
LILNESRTNHEAWFFLLTLAILTYFLAVSLFFFFFFEKLNSMIFFANPSHFNLLSRCLSLLFFFFEKLNSGCRLSPLSLMFFTSVVFYISFVEHFAIVQCKKPSIPVVQNIVILTMQLLSHIHFHGPI